MHGNNPVRGVYRGIGDVDTKLQVRSIFYTIQGEGPYSGHPALFIRLSGCNLRCHWCDTEWDDVNDKYRDVKDIVDEAFIKARRQDLVVITGGEPLRQPVYSLVRALQDLGFPLIQFETAGTVWREELRNVEGLHFVVSPKTPKVAEEFYTLKNISWKYPLKAGHVAEIDGLPYTNTQIADGPKWVLARPQINYPTSRVYVTPVDEGPLHTDLTKANIKQVVASSQRWGYVAQLQIHKYLGVE